MNILNTFKKSYAVTGAFALLVVFSLTQAGSSAFAACAKAEDCFSCHTTQELNTVHKNTPYQGQSCIVCHKAFAADDACSDAKDGKFAKISSEINIGKEDWNKIQRAVHETTEKHLVGRKFLNIYGPLGTGAQSVPLDTYGLPSWASIDMLGEGNEAIHPLKREIAQIYLIYKDFWLFRRDIESGKKCETPLDISAATGAAVSVSMKEDGMVFNGISDMGIPGLLNVSGRNIMKLSDWSVIGNGFQDVVSAVEKLTSKGFNGPFALVVSPKLYAYLHRVYERTGQLEIHGVKELVKGGIYQSNVLKKDVALVVATGSLNMDLAVGTNYKVEYWGPQDLNHRFRVVGSSVLRIKCPQAICTLE